MQEPTRKGYYEDYLRKVNTDRSMPPTSSLLTDRSSYVNFLEVQLERVSAACMNVNSYDQRFNDMQNLIVALEERCANTTKLVSLAQKCTEEVRGEMDSKLDSLIDNIGDENKKLKEALTVVATRVSDTEITLADYAVLPARLGNAEARISEAEETARNAALESLEERAVANKRLEELESGTLSMSHTIDGMQADILRQNKVVEENDTRLHSLVANVESRLKDLQIRDRQEIEMKLDNLKFDLGRDIEGVDDYVKEVELALQHQKVDFGASLAHQAVVLKGEFQEMHEKYAESMKASLNKLTSQVYKELDEVHETTEALEKKIKDRMKEEEKEFKAVHKQLEDHGKLIEANQTNIEKNEQKVEALGPVLTAMARRENLLKQQAEQQAERTNRIEARMDQTAEAVKKLGAKAVTTDRKLDHEHRARVHAQRLQETENARVLQLIDKEADKLAQEHKERLEHEHMQNVLDGQMRRKIEQEAAEREKEHTSRVEQEHVQRALNDEVLHRIASEAEALKREHLERLEAEAKQSAIDSDVRRSLEREAAALAQEHKERLEQQILQKDLDVRLQFEIRQEAEKLGREHSERLQAELSQKAIDRDLQRKIDIEAAALATEHRERLMAEARQHELDGQLEDRLQSQIDEEAAKLEKEHKERLELEAREKAIDQDIRDAIDREHQEVVRMQREKLEQETRQKRIDEDMQYRIDEETKKLEKEHLSRLEAERGQALLTDELRAQHEAEAEALAKEHRDRMEDSHRQAALSSKIRGEIAAEGSKIREEHRQRLESEARQEALDDDVKRSIQEQADKLAREHKALRIAERKIVFQPRNGPKNEVEGVEDLMEEELIEEVLIGGKPRVVDMEEEENAELDEPVRGHGEYPFEAWPFPERHLEARIAPSPAKVQLRADRGPAAEVKATSLTRAPTQTPGVALAPAPLVMPLSPRPDNAETGGSAAGARTAAAGADDARSISTLDQAIQGFQIAGQAQRQAPSAQLKTTQSSYEPPMATTPTGSPARGGDSHSRVPTIIPTTRAAYLRRAASHSPSRSRDARSRRQRLRAEALERSTELATGDNSSLRSSRSKSVMSRKEQIARDNARSYYLHEQQVQDHKSGLFNPEPNPLLAPGEDPKLPGGARVRLHPATAIPVAAGGLNTSFNTDISGISDTMITYEGQPAKTRFLTPYFKRNPQEGPTTAVPVQDRNRGLYGEGLWLPNRTSLPPSVPVGSTQRRAVKFVNNVSEHGAQPKLTQASLRAISEATVARQVEEAIAESKGGVDPPAAPPAATASGSASAGSIRAIVSHLMSKMESNSTAPSTSSSSQHPPSIEVFAEKPRRAVIAPKDHIKGAAVQVTRQARKKK